MQTGPIIPITIECISQVETIEVSVTPSVQTQEVEVVQTPTPQKKKKRCTHCNKRVGIFGFTCKCGSVFCEAHGLPESHNCTFDFKLQQRKILEKNNPRVVARQVDFI